MKEELLKEIKERGLDLHLRAYSEQTEADWYGDYGYYDNPLTCFAYCDKHCIYIPHESGGRGMGTEYADVYTTEEFIHYMGWDNILKYKVND